MLNKAREFLERFFPSEPLKISFSRIKLFLLFMLGALTLIFLYLRSQNKIELESLKQKHSEIQLAVQSYLEDMTHANYTESKLQEIQSKINSYRKQLEAIEEKISDIRNFWFLQ